MNDTTFCTTPVLKSRPYEQCYALKEFVARALQGTDYRFGEIHFAEPMGGESTWGYRVVALGAPRGAVTVFHEIAVVIDPRRGMLLMRDTGRCWGESQRQLSRRTAQEYRELRRLEAKIRERLALESFWQDKVAPIASAIVVGRERPRAIRVPAGVAADAVLNRDVLADFKGQLDRLFEALLPAGACRAPETLERLVYEVAESGQLGAFFDEEYLLDFYREWDGEDDERECEGEEVAG